MRKKTVRDIDLANKRVLVRVDFNVPIKEGRVTDDSRIRAALPTIQYLREQNCRVILMSHLGRPKDGPDPAFALDPVATRLAQLLTIPVRKVDELSGPGVEAAVAAMQPGDVLLAGELSFRPAREEERPRSRAGARPAGRRVRQRRFQRRPPGPRHHRRPGERPPGSGRLLHGEGSRRARGDPCPSRSGRSWWYWAAPRSPTRSRSSTVSSTWPTRLLIGGAMSTTFLKAAGPRRGRQQSGRGRLGHGCGRAQQGRRQPLRSGAPGRRARSGHVRRRRGDQSGEGRRHPRGLDGHGHRPGDGRQLWGDHRRGRHGLLERADGRVRDGRRSLPAPRLSPRPWPSARV